MSYLDTIESLATDVLTVQRRGVGAFTDGVYAQGAAATFTITAVVQPAFNLNRVIGGANLSAKVDDQQTTEVRQLWTQTLLKTRTTTNDPDVVINYQGASWTVARVEEWTLEDETHYHCVIAKQTFGGS